MKKYLYLIKNSKITTYLKYWLMYSSKKISLLIQSLPITLENTIKDLKIVINKIYGNTKQDGEPTPENPVPIENITGDVEITISNENNTESKTLSVSLGNIELCKLGNYQDYIYKNEGNWYVHKNTIKIDLSTITSYIHTSGWRNPTAFVADNVFIHGYSGYTTVASLFCNRLIADTPARITGSVINAIGLGRNSSMYISVEGITTSNALITYFSQNPTYLYAPLARPTDTEITDTTLISQLEEISKTLSYEGQTNISSNQNIYLDIDYIKRG